MRRCSFVFVCCLLAASGCDRAPPVGSGDVETTRDGGARPSPPVTGFVVASYPGGAVLVANRAACTLSLVSQKDAVKWTHPLRGCEGFIEIAVAHDSIAYARTSAGLVAVTMDGVERWRLEVSAEPVPAAIAAPAITPDSIVVVASSPRTVVAFKTEGTEAWHFSVDPGEHIVTSPIGGRGEGVVVLTNAALYALGSDGQLRWRGPPGGKP